MFHININNTGVLAHDILINNTILEIFTVFNKSFYAIDSQERLVCFLLAPGEPGPLNILSTSYFNNLAEFFHPNDIIYKSHSNWRTDNFIFNTQNSLIYTPPPWSKVNNYQLKQNLLKFLPLIPLLVDSNHLLHLWFNSSEKLSKNQPHSYPLFKRIAKSLDLLTSWLINYPHQLSPPTSQVVYNLLGLGLGLTPSGDDILAGVLLTNHFLANNIFIQSLNQELYKQQSQTNFISWSHLLAAGQGLASKVFHDFLITFNNDTELEINNLIYRIKNIGHQSGLDTLLGILICLYSHLFRLNLITEQHPLPNFYSSGDFI